MAVNPAARWDVAPAVTEVPSFLVAGFQTDCNKFLDKFAQTNSVRFEQFQKVWQDMKFSLVFSLRPSEKERIMFTEECLQIALRICLHSESFQQRVGGLYLLYGIFSTQPLVPKVMIRVVLSQWLQLEEFYNVIEEQEHHDARFIFLKLKLCNAFAFVATPTEMGPIAVKAMSEIERVSDHLKEKTSELVQLMKTDNFEQLRAIHNQYQSTKCAINESDVTQPDSSLNVVQQNISTLVQRLVEDLERKKEILKKKSDRELACISDEDIQELEALTDEEVPGGDDVGPRRTHIKKKAMKSHPKNKRTIEAQTQSREEEHGTLAKKKRKMSKKQTGTGDDIYEEDDVEKTDSGADLSMPVYVEEELGEKSDTTTKEKTSNKSTDEPIAKKSVAGKKRQKEVDTVKKMQTLSVSNRSKDLPVNETEPPVLSVEVPSQKTKRRGRPKGSLNRSSGPKPAARASLYELPASQPHTKEEMD